jgi:fatty-acid peroxygenase
MERDGYRAPVPMDRTASLLLDGYLFGERLRREAGTDVVRTRLLGRPAVVVVGAEAARLVYDQERFERATVLPTRIQKTLTGTRAVQTLDGGAHAARKALFLSMMGDGRTETFRELVAEEWRSALDRWHPEQRVVLFDEAREVFFRAACGWTGTPVPERDAPVVAAALASLVAGFATVGPRHWLARASRQRLELWAADVVRGVRDGTEMVDDASPVALLAWHREDGRLLDDHVTAVELLNLLRPITAIAWYATFVAHALHAHPLWQERLRVSGDAEVEAFVHEVRRRYPFTPFVGGRVRRPFAWRGETFEAGTLVILDVVGTDHDPRRWDDPTSFRPERFLSTEPDAFAYVPQGGGSHADGHRCAGERVTIEGMAATTAFLAREVRYEVPPQDLRIPMGRMPTRPRSGMVLADVRRVAVASSVPAEPLPQAS